MIVQKALYYQEKPIPQIVADKIPLLQSAIRTLLAKQHFSSRSVSLDKERFKVGKSYIDRSILGRLPTSLYAKSNVFLPIGEPIVIKEACAEISQRVIKARELKEICVTLGLTHLEIPRVSACPGYTIEEKIPILHTIKGQMCLYSLSPFLFDKAVEDFTHLVFNTDVKTGMTTVNRLPFSQSFSQNSAARYDNISFVVRGNPGEEVGTLAILDNECFVKEIDKRDPKWSARKCLTLIIFFPHHFELIYKIAVQYDQEVLLYAQSLRNSREEALTCLNYVCTTHNAYVERMGDVDLNRFEINKLVSREAFLLSLVDWVSSRHYFIYLDSIDLVVAKIGVIIEMSEVLINDLMEHNRLRQPAIYVRGDIGYQSEMLSNRTLVISLNNPTWVSHLAKIGTLLNHIEINNKNMFVELFACQVFHQLMRHKFICYFNPTFRFNENLHLCFFV